MIPTSHKGPLKRKSTFSKVANAKKVKSGDIADKVKKRSRPVTQPIQVRDDLSSEEDADIEDDVDEEADIVGEGEQLPKDPKGVILLNILLDLVLNDMLS